MNLKTFFHSNTLGSLLGNIGLAIGIILLFGIAYFYVYLPNATNHGDEIAVPDLKGKSITQIDSVLSPLLLRYEVGDSSYSADYLPLTVLNQFPKPGHRVKENRKIIVTINRSSTPTLPIPDLVDRSWDDAEEILKSIELKRGKKLLKRYPFKNLVLEMRMNGKVLTPGARVSKGSVIDLVVGDGAGPRDFVINNFVGLPYQNVLLRLGNLSLHIGTVQIPEGVDTTGIVSYVLKQLPAAGDSVSIGDPIDLWIGPKGYELKEEENEDARNPE